ncbi:FAD-dependent oxidoreductase [Pseudonocardia acaciae]|uniref:FAD-dependent oxidoreductase n=1 Tax=Pseudonocardia acaciae TaxID=551276 RepID=UPI00048DE385|nr:FAD-dependent oxidoreductase [Pseudonocardia acaciae]
MPATVAVIGGGYGGITVAKALDDVADVVLVEPRDAFVHNVAALRAVVDPAWPERLFFGYERLLDRGRVVRDRAVRVDGTAVTLGSGERIIADYIVLATGSAYPFPAKIPIEDRAGAIAALRATHDDLARSDGVLLLGAGPVGLELAGELKAARPDRAVTIVDPAGDVLAGGLSGLAGGFPEELRAELRRQLDALGVELVLGTSLAEQPPSEPGEVKAFSATTVDGRRIVADIWFRCYGVVATSDYLAGELANARRANGQVEVTAELRLPGQDRVFAIGDLTALPEAKMAKAAGEHAEVVAGNIRTLISGGDRLAGYRPGGPAISLPLGPAGGASYAPGVGLLGAEDTARLKGADLRTGPLRETFGQAE